VKLFGPVTVMITLPLHSVCVAPEIETVCPVANPLMPEAIVAVANGAD